LDKRSQGGAGHSDLFDVEFALGLGGNAVTWHLGNAEESIVNMKYTDAGAIVEINYPIRQTFKLDGFVCFRIAEGIYYQFGYVGFGPISGTIMLITDYTRAVCTGAVVVMNDIIPAGGWGEVTSYNS